MVQEENYQRENTTKGLNLKQRRKKIRLPRNILKEPPIKIGTLGTCWKPCFDITLTLPLIAYPVHSGVEPQRCPPGCPLPQGQHQAQHASRAGVHVGGTWGETSPEC